MKAIFSFLLLLTFIPLAGSRGIHLPFTFLLLLQIQPWSIETGISCPKDWKSLTSGCFIFQRFKHSYKSASDYCLLINDRAVLPVFRSRADWKIFSTYLEELPRNRYFWIGGNDEQIKGNFTIEDPVSKLVCQIGFVEYVNGHPDNCLAAQGQRVNYLPCGHHSAVVCHIPNFVICGSTTTNTTAFATTYIDSDSATTNALATAITAQTAVTMIASSTAKSGDGKQENTEPTESNASIKPEYIVLGLAFALLFIVFAAIACTIYCSLAKTKELTQQVESSPASGILIKMSYSPPWKEKTASKSKESKFTNNIENKKQNNTVNNLKG